jgi:hypothetical protein
MGSSGGSPTQTTTTELPAWAQPYATSLLNAGFGQALPGGQPGPSPLPYSQVAPFTQDQLKGFDYTRSAAEQAQGLSGAYGGYLNDVVGGKYLDPDSNPYLSKYYDAASRDVMRNYTQAVSPEVLRTAIQSGTPFSSGTAQGYANAQEGLHTALTDLGAKIYAPAYQQERGYQQQGASMLPSAMQAGFLPGEAYGQIGGQQQGQQQQIYNQAYQNIYNQSNWPYQALSNAGSYIPAAVGGTGSVNVQGANQGSIK